MRTIYSNSWVACKSASCNRDQSKANYLLTIDSIPPALISNHTLSISKILIFLTRKMRQAKNFYMPKYSSRTMMELPLLRTTLFHRSLCFAIIASLMMNIIKAKMVGWVNIRRDRVIYYLNEEVASKCQGLLLKKEWWGLPLMRMTFNKVTILITSPKIVSLRTITRNSWV